MRRFRGVGRLGRGKCRLGTVHVVLRGGGPRSTNISIPSSTTPNPLPTYGQRRRRAIITGPSQRGASGASLPMGALSTRRHVTRFQRLVDSVMKRTVTRGGRTLALSVDGRVHRAILGRVGCLVQRRGSVARRHCHRLDTRVHKGLRGGRALFSGGRGIPGVGASGGRGGQGGMLGPI